MSADVLSFLPDGYVYVLLDAVVMSFLIIFIGGMAGSLRGKDPWKSVKYPDQGSGIYANKLKESDWITFNNYQRAHYNFLEGIASALTLLFISGLFYPRLVGVLGAVYNVGRLLYAIGYQRNGPKGRTVGVILVDGALVVMLVLCLYALGTRIGARF